MRKLIGTQVVSCAADIVTGTILMDQVEMLIISTRCATREEFVDVVCEFVGEESPYYRELPNTLITLYDQGKIMQPRLDDPNGWVPEFRGSYWVDADTGEDFSPHRPRTAA